MFLHQKDIDRKRRTDGQGDFYLTPPPQFIFVGFKNLFHPFCAAQNLYFSIISIISHINIHVNV